LQLTADLRARQTLTSVTFDAPKEMRAKPRITWLLRQLADAPSGLRVEVHYPNARDTTGLLLKDARENVDGLLYPPDTKREPKAFTLTLARAMGRKRGKAEGSFVAETSAQAFDFYGDLVQNLKAWTPRAPRLREEDPPPAAGASAAEPLDATSPQVA
jgi:hypothetical protein